MFSLQNPLPPPGIVRSSNEQMSRWLESAPGVVSTSSILVFTLKISSFDMFSTRWSHLSFPNRTGTRDGTSPVSYRMRRDYECPVGYEYYQGSCQTKIRSAWPRMLWKNRVAWRGGGWSIGWRVSQIQETVQRPEVKLQIITSRDGSPGLGVTHLQVHFHPVSSGEVTKKVRTK